MKVLYICPTPELYGDSKALLNIIPELVKSGVNPIFVTPYSGDFSNMVRKMGLECIVSGFGSWTTFKGKLSVKIICGFFYHYILELRRYRILKKQIETIHPDIIHTNSTTTKMGYRLSKDLKIPHIWHIREYGLLDHGWSHFPSKEEFERYYTSPNNFSISITKDVYIYNSSPRNGVVVYDGVFDKDKIPTIDSSDEGYFLYVGRVIESKGVMELINVYRQYVSDNISPCVLKIVGEGSLMSKLEGWIVDNKMADYIELLGYKKNVSELMSKAKALIVPSPNEAFGFITAEAMFNGCLVIGRNTAGTKLQFDNCRNISGRDVAFRYETPNELLNLLSKVSCCSKSDFLGKIKIAQECVTELYSTVASASSVYNYYYCCPIKIGID